MSKEPRAATTGASQWTAQAARVLENLGFSLIEADPAAGDTAQLLVALRPAPTLQHFDPEQIAYWVTEAGRGKAATLDRETRCPVDGTYSWGRIEITDRLCVTNQFLSFGGDLRAEMVADSTILVSFSSLAPIMRWSGHSQVLDPLTVEVGAFFARMMVPIDFVPGAEALVAAAAGRTLYCAFIQHARERLSRARTLRDSNRWLSDYSARESQRLESASPDNWKAAAELRLQLGPKEAAARD